MGAERMCMPSPTIEQFIHALKQIVNANKSWVRILFLITGPPRLVCVYITLYILLIITNSTYCLWIVLHVYVCIQVPPPGKGSLYIRPLLMGSGPVLGAMPAAEYTFLIFASPVGIYHKVRALI